MNSDPEITPAEIEAVARRLGVPVRPSLGDEHGATVEVTPVYRYHRRDRPPLVGYDVYVGTVGRLRPFKQNLTEAAMRHEVARLVAGGRRYILNDPVMMGG